MCKYIKHSIVVAGFAAFALSFSSCAPFPPSHPMGSPGQAHSAKSIDPRFIGTWVGYNDGETVVMSLAPDGRGRLHVRKRGKFDHGSVMWSTRSNILELRRGGGGFGSGGGGYSLFRSNLSVRVHNNPYYNRYRHQQAAPQMNVFRLNVTSFRKRKFIARDLAKPREAVVMYKYSDQPSYDPYPVYAWFDNGGARQIDKKP